MDVTRNTLIKTFDMSLLYGSKVKKMFYHSYSNELISTTDGNVIGRLDMRNGLFEARFILDYPSAAYNCSGVVANELPNYY